uniref:Selenocysteine-specific elongation factor n=1 Tax=Ciona savignyi TaxID=51511 RepID=H2YEH6_CIOSA
ANMEDILNFNIGMLGHVDSGKTSLAKALSTVASTAAFDKNPQSKERGITLDLGFSSFSVELPAHLKESKFTKLQYTLVDCPGHASLIKTIIGGAQIIDLMVLVIDVIKGVQTQTAECLVIGEIVCNRMLVVLNKVDLLAPEKRQSAVEKMKKRMHKTLENTKFAGCPIATVAANPGASPDDITHCKPEGIEELIKVLGQNTYIPNRSSDGTFLFSVDHCFSIRGQGTVMTGTVLSGKVSVNDTVEISNLQATKKVKSIQMFRKPTSSVKQGDRAGLCVTQFDPKLLERGLVCSPGTLPTLYAAIVRITKIAYYVGEVLTKSKFHVTIGHATVMARITIFAQDSSSGDKVEATSPPVGAVENLQLTQRKFDFSVDYIFRNELSKCVIAPQWALLEFEKPVVCKPDSLAIGSRFDSDVNANKCRLAFKAEILEAITSKDYVSSVLPKLKVYKNKSREGTVERVHDEESVICRGLLKKETNVAMFTGLRVELSTGERGIIEGSFGLSGKVKIRVRDGLKPETISLLGGKGKKSKKKLAESSEIVSQPVKVNMQFLRYIYDPAKRMAQT